MHQDQRPNVTVVVVPRESFNMFPEVIHRIYEATPPIFKMLVMEGHAPERIRRQLQQLEKTHLTCKVIRSDRWLYPHEAVNLAMPMIDTEFVVFIDNDVEVTEGWLEALVRCAIEEKVGCVHPIYLVGQLEDRKIHVAQGKLLRRVKDGELFIDSVMSYSGKRVSELPDLNRKPSEFFEWHCVLFRKSLLDKVGPLRPLTIAEHLDYVFRMNEVGEKILLEPKSLVAYDYERIFKLRGVDRKYFLFRWSPKEAEKSLLDYCHRWGLHVESMRARQGWGLAHWQKVNSMAFNKRVIRRAKRLFGIPVEKEWVEAAHV